MKELALLILNSVYGVMQWYGDPENFANLNVDGLFGLRILEGQLKHIWMDYDLGNFQKADRSVILSIKELSENATKIANSAVPHVFSSQPEYFQKFKFLLANPFDSTYDIRITDPGKVWSNPSDFDFDEKKSDECLAELLLSAPSGDDVVEEIPGQKLPKMNVTAKCDLSIDCLQYMMDGRDWNGYMLQHEVLYTILAEMVGCPHTLEAQLLSNFDIATIAEYQTELCTNALFEMEQSIAQFILDDVAVGDFSKPVEEPKIPFRGQDLFIEQQFLCGHLGFVEFTRREWLEMIMSWQLPSGCFSYLDWAGRNDKKGTTTYATRRLLEEHRMKGNCGAHKTAVAAGALMVYLRFTLENVQENRHIKHLDPNFQPPSNISIPTRGKFLKNFKRYEKAAKVEIEESLKDDPEDEKDEETVREEMDKRKKPGKVGLESAIRSPFKDSRGKEALKGLDQWQEPPMSYYFLSAGFIFALLFYCLCKRRNRVWRRWSHLI